MEQVWADPAEFCGWSEAFLSLRLVLGPPGNPAWSCPPAAVATRTLSLAGIPTLIVLDPQGEVITRQGRVEVLNDEDCREFPWHPKPVLELSDSNAVQLNEGPCLVLFVGMKLSGGPGVGDAPQVGDACPYSFFLPQNNAEPGPLSLPAALLLTPMIYSWLSPWRRGFWKLLPRFPS